MFVNLANRIGRIAQCDGGQFLFDNADPFHLPCETEIRPGGIFDSGAVVFQRPEGYGERHDRQYAAICPAANRNRQCTAVFIVPRFETALWNVHSIQIQRE